MRHLVLLLAGVSLLAACGGIPPGTQASSGTRRLEADFDLACEAVIRVVGERGYVLRSVDRTAGVIDTDWYSINPDYAASIIMTEHQDRYSDCGKPGLVRTFRGKQMRLRVKLSPVRRAETDLKIDAVFRTQRYASFLFWMSRSPGEWPCQSRGRLEEELVVQMKLWSLGEQLERLRRGTP